MASKRAVELPVTQIDFTSMIDICFLLITFFIMVTSVAKAEVVEVFLPFANNAIPDETPPENRVIVNVDRKGELYIRSKKYGKPNEPNVRKEVTLLLQACAEEAGFDTSKKEKPSNLSVYIRSDANAMYKYVQCVMMILVHENVRVDKVHYVTKNPTLPAEPEKKEGS